VVESEMTQLSDKCAIYKTSNGANLQLPSDTQNAKEIQRQGLDSTRHGLRTLPGPRPR